MKSRLLEKYSSFYFIGIGGVSMSGLARFLLAMGKTVAGSDACRSVYTDELSELGVDVNIEKRNASIDKFDVIVFTDAIHGNDVQLVEAKKLNKEIISRGQLLYEVSRTFCKVIAVSGCHGKTTVTSMLAHVFEAAGKRFAVHVGGRDKKFSNSYYCGNDYFITEACEYKKNFLLLKPDIAIILNTDPDHLECYGSVENLRAAYLSFAKSSEISVSLFGDLNADGVTFGYDENSDYYAKKIKGKGGTFSFTIFEGANALGQVNLQTYGKHNVLNALAVTAAARAAGISFKYIKTGLETFGGVERRFETIGFINGARCIADYAHHPNEIRATLKAAKNITDGKIYVVFQPHTYSRTRNLFSDFVKVLAPLNNLMIYRTFAAREYFDDAGSALTLSQSLKRSRYGDDKRDIGDFIANSRQGDLVLFLGAGDIYDIAKELVKSNARF